MLNSFIVLHLLIRVSFSNLGVDVSAYTDVFSCLTSSGYSFSVVRGYTSYRSVDPNLIANLNNAWNGGMNYVDVYLFPCVPCGNPAGQASSLVTALKGHRYGMIWMDIETYAWSSSLSANQNLS